MSTVYVLNKDGKPLMPTTRGGHVRHLLKEQKAPAAHITVKRMDITTQTTIRNHLVNVSMFPKTKGVFLHKLVDHLFP